MAKPGALSLVPSAEPAALRQESWSDPGQFDVWRIGVRRTVLTHVAEFVAHRCAAELDEAGVAVAGDILLNFLTGGKCLRSTFMYLGWLCGASDSDEALYASASLELLHAFALIQDDVMDRSALRRGRPAAHVRLAEWYAAQHLAGDARHFGESAAVLLGDLLLVWADQMLRDSGLPADALARAWPVYDRMRGELAVGQFADLVYDARHREGASA